VTEADRAAEARIRVLIEAHYPDHGIKGEEYADRPGAGPLAWSIDPIDGTRAFVCGLPSWAILIALLDEGQPVVGLIDVPALDERYVGQKGASRLILAGEERPIASSDCRGLAEARLSTTDPFLFAGAEAEGFERLRARARLTRYGLDAYGYARLADGTIDLVVESGLKPHDYNALAPVVRGAGGVIGNWRGGDDISGGDLVAAATRALFDEAVAVLNL
jgi:myo-inositol-1(or 4)-monophosphatase